MEFIGPGQPISESGFAAASEVMSADAATLWAVLSVETSGSGYLCDKRPKILFERHIFHRLTGGRYDADDPDISFPMAGGYGQGGAAQYLRLECAMQLDQDAALMSASWGIGQILGENFRAAGFAQISGMISSMVSSEDEQLNGMAKFVTSQGIAQSLSNKNWSDFARRYNGPNYAANNYDGLLQHFYQGYKCSLPNLNVRAAQMYLSYRGFSVGRIDGVLGDVTIHAVEDFQRASSMPVTGKVDGALLEILSGQ